MIRCEIHAYNYVRVAVSDLYMAGTSTRREDLVFLRGASLSAGEARRFLDTLAGPAFLRGVFFMVFSIGAISAPCPKIKIL